MGAAGWRHEQVVEISGEKEQSVDRQHPDPKRRNRSRSSQGGQAQGTLKKRMSEAPIGAPDILTTAATNYQLLYAITALRLLFLH
jgi:hypothetical protein